MTKEESEFDLTSNLVYKKSYKVKVRVKAVTKYNPIIVIE